MEPPRQPDRSDLPEASRSALEAAALLEPPFLVATLLGLGCTPEALDPLFDSGLLRETSPGQAEFARAECRDEILGSLAWSRKRRLCEQLAKLLSGRDETLGQAAQLYGWAHRYGEARGCWVRAAEAACRRGQYEAALGHFRRALELWPAHEELEDRDRQLREMARCARHAGNFAGARLAWEELLETSRLSGAIDRQMEAHTQLAELAPLAGEPASATAHLRAAAELAQRHCSPLEAARQWFALANHLGFRLRLTEAAAAIERAHAAAEQAGNPVLLIEALGSEGLLLALRGKRQEAHARVQAALELALKHNLPDQVASAYRHLGHVQEFTAEYAGSRDSHLQALALCRQQRNPSGERACLACLSYAFFRTGQWKRAEETARKLLADPEADPVLQAVAGSVPAMIAAFRGQRRGADARLEAALFQARAQGMMPVEFHLLWARALLAEFDGRPSAAADLYGELRARWLDTEDRACAVPGLVSAAAFHADRREAALLAACSEILGLIARDNGNEETCAARQAALAESAWCNGNALQALEAMTEALNGYDRLGTSLEMALMRWRFGRMLAAAGRPREAEDSRREASEIARRLGLRPLLDRLHNDAVAQAPAAGPKAQCLGVAGLTPRQRAIVGLIAKGLTNKEIASHLNLSPRTVEMHVALALERLNCRTRSEAASRATAQGLLEGSR